MATDVQDIALDPDTWDWTTENGDLKLTSGVDSIVQNVGVVVKFFYGEWFLDPTLGVKYFQVIFQKAPNFGLIRQELRRAIESAPGILTVTALVFTFITKTRKLKVYWSASTDLGELKTQSLTTPGV